MFQIPFTEENLHIWKHLPSKCFIVCLINVHDLSVSKHWWFFSRVTLCFMHHIPVGLFGMYWRHTPQEAPCWTSIIHPFRANSFPCISHYHWHFPHFTWLSEEDKTAAALYNYRSLLGINHHNCRGRVSHVTLKAITQCVLALAAEINTSLTC